VAQLGLWGPVSDLDYWTARGRGLVPAQERRAVALLASVCDEPRFAAYLRTGRMAAMGNVTKRLYIVRRFGTVVELEDGRPSFSWCIGTADRSGSPPTDHVVAMKNLIEGEELFFRETGNATPSSFVYDGSHKQGPYEVSLLPLREHQDPRRYDWGRSAEFSAMKKTAERLKWKKRFAALSWGSLARWEGRPRSSGEMRRREEALRKGILRIGPEDPLKEEAQGTAMTAAPPQQTTGYYLGGAVGPDFPFFGQQPNSGATCATNGSSAAPQVVVNFSGMVCGQNQVFIPDPLPTRGRA
jgi:hypothetical protein